MAQKGRKTSSGEKARILHRHPEEKLPRADHVPHSPFKVRARKGARRIVRFFGGRSSRDLEYDFAYRNVAGQRLRVLGVCPNNG
jgi:hypothetical protein